MNRTWTGNTKGRLFFLACLVSLTAITAAQNLGLLKAKIGREIDVRCLYPAGSNSNYGVLYPLVLEYHNKSLVPQTFELSWSLQNEIPAEYKVVVLEPGSKKRIPFLFPPGEINQLYSLEVNDQNIPVGVTTNHQGRVTGLLTSDDDNLDYIRSMQLVKNPYYNPTEKAEGAEYNTPQDLSSLDEEVFPDHWAALESLEVLVCYDLTALSFSNLQYQALANWVRRGGELVIVSNGIPTEYAGTPLEEILPLTPESIATEEGMVRVEGPLKPGVTTLVGSSGKEILLERTVLEGKVYYLTVPLLDDEMLGKEETQRIWRFVFDKQPNYANSPHSFTMMNSMPELPRTNAAWVALFVIMYGIIVGPVNLSILRKRDKMLWSFVTVPVVAILFAGSAYVLNRFVRPSTPVLRELGYLSIQAEDRFGFAEAEQLLFSPHGQTFTVRSDATAFFKTTDRRYRAFGSSSQGFGLYTSLSDGGLQSELNMGTWDIRRFEAGCNMEVESPFLVKTVSENVIEIEAPMGSSQESATVSLPSKGTSDLFTLKAGKHRYQLTFKKASSPMTIHNWNESQYPGRDDLLGQVYSAQPTETGKLYFWTEEMATPLQIDRGTLSRHDYLVCVEFQP